MLAYSKYYQIVSLKIFFLIAISIAAFTNSFAQVGISATAITPDASSILELRSTTKGFLPPRMTTTERDAITPVTGLVIYNISTGLLDVYNGSSWQMLGAQMAANTIKGNNTGSTANASDLTVAQVNAMLPTFTSSLNGLVSASGGGTANFLRADGTWASPPSVGGGTVTSVSVLPANGFAGTVATATTTPAITISTSVNGIAKGNGTALSAAASGTDFSAGTSALATGILKSTTITGALSTAVAADFPTLNQNTTGNAATVTTNANLSGDVTSVGNATTIGSGKVNNAMLANANEAASIVAATLGINTIETIVVKTAALAANRLVAGTVIRITMIGTTTASVANASTFAVRIGILGTIVDGLLATVATAASATTGTAVPFKAVIELTIRTTTTAYATLNVFNTGGTSTGISIIPVQVKDLTMSALNTATASQIISATYKSAGLTTTSTFQQAFIEFIYK